MYLLVGRANVGALVVGFVVGALVVNFVVCALVVGFDVGLDENTQMVFSAPK